MKLTQLLRARGQFKYFKRYVERTMQKDYISRTWHPLTGYVTKQKKNWYYGEFRPWTSDFMDENRGRMNKKTPVLVVQPKEWNMFKGDRVEVLVGKDKGKQGIINSIIKERNWVYVEGLNCKYRFEQQDKDVAPVCVAEEEPLYYTQVALIDPSDDENTEIEWRYTEEGERVRVSTRTGIIIPLPAEADMYEDFVVPKTYVENKDKDTTEKILKKVTFAPKLSSFEQEIMDAMNIKEDRKRAPTYWY